jgi:hypothetical protein
MMRACTTTRCALLLLHNAARRLSSSALATKQEIKRVRQPGLETFTKDFFQVCVAWTTFILYLRQMDVVVAPVQPVCHISDLKLSIATVSHAVLLARNNMSWTLTLPGSITFNGIPMSPFHAYCKLDKEDDVEVLQKGQQWTFLGL